jgi:hypothetical protein
MGGDITTIAVVGGTGAKGSAIALRLGHAGYRVIIGTRNSSRGARMCEELNGILGHSAVRFATNEEAARAAELVILTVPYNAQIVIAKELGPALEGKIPDRRDRSARAAEDLQRTASGRRLGGRGGSADVGRQGGGGFGIPECRRSQVAATGRGCRMRCPCLRRCRVGTRRNARHDRQNGVTRARCRADLQFGRRGSTDINFDISESEIQSGGLWHQHYRTGRRARGALKAPAPVCFVVYSASSWPMSLGVRTDSCRARAHGKRQTIIFQLRLRATASLFVLRPCDPPAKRVQG